MSADIEQTRTRPAPPRLEVLPGVFFDEITTLARCDEILDEVIGSIPSIEGQIDHAGVGGSTRTDDRTWLPRAKHALRIRKLCMPKLQQLRAQLARQEKADVHAERTKPVRDHESRDRMFVQIVWEIAPEVAAQAKGLLQHRHPELDAPQANVGEGRSA